MKRIFTVFEKELTIFLRDKRTIFTTFVLPIFFYLIMFNVMTSIALKTKKQIKEKKVSVGYSQTVPSEIVSFLAQNNSGISLKKINVNESEILLRSKKIDCYIHYSNKKLSVYYNGAKRLSREAQRRVVESLEKYKKEFASKKLKELNIGEDILTPFEIEKRNMASEKDMGLAFLGRIMPYLIIIMLFSGAMGFGLEVSTGEKEKGTIATLLVSQASRTEIVLGKLFYVIFVEILYVVANIAGFLIASKSFASKVSEELSKEMVKNSDKIQATSFSLEPSSILLFFLLVIPIGLISAALIMAIGSYAKSMKEGQTFMTPVILIIVFIAVLTINAPLQIPEYYFFIPVLNTAFAMQEILLGKIVLKHIVFTMITTLGLAGILIGFSVFLFNRENIHFRV